MPKNRLYLMLFVITLGACASRTPQLDARFGQSVNFAKARQTIDPQAASKAPEPRGIDGNAAVESMQRYRDSFRAPPPTFVIINGGAAGAGAR
jgi:hypothetical protein